MLRRSAMLAALFAVAGAAGAAAERAKVQEKLQEKVQEPASGPELPLHLYIAKGGPNACGPGCSEWIAAEGRFDSGAAARATAFVQRNAARRLPVYFDSPGGSGTEAIALGRQLRTLGVTTGVGRTVPHGCAPAGESSAACRAAKRPAQAVIADWRPDGDCSSACVFALLGGRVREVPPSAHLGVHAGKLTGVRRYSDGRVQPMTAQQLALHNGKLAAIDADLRRYVREMGISGALMDVALRVPNESVHYLSRDQIVRFGIDRRDFVQSPWFVTQLASSTSHLSKWIVEARGPARNDNRMSVILVACSNGRNATIRFLRGLTSDEAGRPTTAIVSIGNHKARFALRGEGTKLDMIDSGSLFASAASQVPFGEIEAAVSRGDVSLEIDPPQLSPSPRIALATDGLADGISRLRETCGPAPKPVVPKPVVPKPVVPKPVAPKPVLPKPVPRPGGTAN